MEILDDQNVVFEFTESSVNAIISLGVDKSRADLYVAELAAQRRKIKLAVDICEGYAHSLSLCPLPQSAPWKTMHIHFCLKLKPVISFLMACCSGTQIGMREIYSCG